MTEEEMLMEILDKVRWIGFFVGYLSGFLTIIWLWFIIKKE